MLLRAIIKTCSGIFLVIFKSLSDSDVSFFSMDIFIFSINPIHL